MLLTMRPRPGTVDRLLAEGHWDRTTMAEAYDDFAVRYPHAVAVADPSVRYTWQELKAVSDGLAAALMDRGLARGDMVLVQVPGGAVEAVIRVALKKAGLVGAYAPVQWGAAEVGDAVRRLRPAAAIMARRFKGMDLAATLDGVAGTGTDRVAWAGGSNGAVATGGAAATGPGVLRLRIALEPDPPPGWLALPQLLAHRATAADAAVIARRRVRFDEVSMVIASSGSTGLPKLCAWPEAAQLAQGRGVAARLGLSPADNVGIFCPIAGGGGLMLWVCSGVVPCRYTIAGDFEPQALLRLVEQAGVTVIATVPVILARLVQVPDVARYDLRTLRAIRVGTAAVNRALARLAEERLGCVVVPAAGTMETGGFAQVAVDDPAPVRHGGSVGRPLPDCRVRTVDADGRPVAPGAVGELQVWSAHAALGYVGEDPSTLLPLAAPVLDGWFPTGDLATCDGDGQVTIVGRKKEVINRGGFKVIPLEVEQVIQRHPGVDEAAVVGVPDPAYGEVPWAFVVPRRGAALAPADLEGHVRQAGLASFKVPARFVLVADLPRVGGTKVSKRQLLERYGTTGGPA